MKSLILQPAVFRVIAFFKMGIGCHGFGILDKAVPIEHSHGLTADGKTVAPHLEKGDGPAVVLPVSLHRGALRVYFPSSADFSAGSIPAEC